MSKQFETMLVQFFWAKILYGADCNGTAHTLGLLVGTEAPDKTLNSIDISFFSFLTGDTCINDSTKGPAAARCTQADGQAVSKHYQAELMSDLLCLMKDCVAPDCEQVQGLST